MVSGLIVLAFLTIVSTEWRGKQHLGEVEVEGLQLVSRDEVLRLMDVRRDSAEVLLKDVELRDIRTRLLTHPCIANAGVTFDREGSILVRVSERAPIGVLVHSSGAMQYVDSTSTCFEYRPSAAVDVPLVFNVNQHNDSEVLDVVHVLLACVDSGLQHKISEIRRDGSEYVLQLTQSRARVRIGSVEQVHERVVALSEFLRSQKSGAFQAMRQIDLRWDDMVFITRR